MLEHSATHQLHDEIEKAESWTDLVGWKTLTGSVGFAQTATKEGKKIFLATRERAKRTGLLLAHYLASDNAVFRGQSVSICGYSLGMAVTKATINRLGKLDRPDIVHNVLALAGATYVRTEKLEY